MARWDTAWHRRLDTELARLPELDPEDARAVRRGLATDPVAFGVIYFSHHLTSPETGGRVTFSEAHYEWCATAIEVTHSGVSDPQEHRHAFIAPRECGKSTWHFLILPMWGAANGLIRFAAAFAHSTGQAEAHLMTFKRELENNALLRADFPELCQPTKTRRGATLADRQGMLHQKSGFIFAARGVDSALLGMKVEERRPDWIVLDDIEPDEASYSTDLAEKRLGTVTDAIFPLNIRARVTMVGTVTMLDSNMHQLVKYAAGKYPDGQAPDWITDEKIRVHHSRPIIKNDDGSLRSLWPAKWPIDWLVANSHTRSYKKNMDNNPLAGGDLWWSSSDFRYGSRDHYDRTVMVVDGAVTIKKTSDFTGISVVGLSMAERKFYVREAIEVRLVGEPLRVRCLELATELDVDYLLVEANQGGDLWHTVFHDMPFKVSTFTQRDRKEVRIKRLLAAYQRSGGHVLHERPLPALEDQQLAYPDVAHEDVLDSVAANVEHLTYMLLRQASGRKRARAVQRFRSA